MNKASGILKKSIVYVILVAAALVTIVPLLWMVSTSLKTSQYTLQLPPHLIPRQPTLQSYTKLLSLFPMLRMLFNSMIVAVFITGGQILTSVMAAYAFARMKFKGRDILFLVFLATMMVPYQVTVIPQFVLMKNFGWLNSYFALIVPSLHTAFGTFLMRQALLPVPAAFEESAFMDGANHFTVFSRIVLPLVKPAVATLGVLAFMSSWNAFLWPLIVTSSDSMMTLPVGLSVLQGRYQTEWNLVMAGGVISLIPIVIVFMFSQRYFIEGLSRGGIKS